VPEALQLVGRAQAGQPRPHDHDLQRRGRRMQVFDARSRQRCSHGYAHVSQKLAAAHGEALESVSHGTSYSCLATLSLMALAGDLKGAGVPHSSAMGPRGATSRGGSAVRPATRISPAAGPRGRGST
jgi:hypothetical protein